MLLSGEREERTLALLAAGMLPWFMIVQEDACRWPQRYHPGLGPSGETQVTFEIMKSILLTRHVIFLEFNF